MARRSAVIALALACALARPASGQSGWEKLGEDVDELADDIVHLWTAPVRVRGDDLPGLAAVAGGTVLLAFFDDEVQDWLRAHPRSLPVRALRPFRESTPVSKLGYTEVLVPLSAGLYAAGLALDRDGLREAGIGCITANLANTLTRHAVARLLGRLRPRFTRDPYVIQPLAFGAWEMRSFPGGHAANIMACTTFWNNRFDLGVAEPLLYALAGAIGVTRTLDEAHWLSDSAFGMVWGWAFGAGTADRFLARAAAEEEGTAAPAAAHRPRFYIGWRIAF